MVRTRTVVLLVAISVAIFLNVSVWVQRNKFLVASEVVHCQVAQLDCNNEQETVIEMPKKSFPAKTKSGIDLSRKDIRKMDFEPEFKELKT